MIVKINTKWHHLYQATEDTRSKKDTASCWTKTILQFLCIHVDVIVEGQYMVAIVFNDIKDILTHPIRYKA